jgi:hypothetical protein
LPKPSFRLSSLLAVPVVVGVGLSVWITYAPPVPIRGDRDIELEVEIYDRVAGNPIGNALVQISDPFRARKASKAMTRGDGRARLVHHFDVVGECRAYRYTGIVQYADRWLEVYAEGYRRVFAPLALSTGEQGVVSNWGRHNFGSPAGTSSAVVERFAVWGTEARMRSQADVGARMWSRRDSERGGSE